MLLPMLLKAHEKPSMVWTGTGQLTGVFRQMGSAKVAAILIDQGEKTDSRRPGGLPG